MLVVVGGHSRNIGKTSVAAGIIAAVPEARWQAIKITQTGYHVCLAETSGGTCRCAPSDPRHPYALDQQHEADPSDTGRFLAAGAARSWWLRTARGNLGHAIPVLKKLLSAAENSIIESNSVLQFVRPDLYLPVLDFSNPDIKDSARTFLTLADALVVVGSKAEPPWPGVPARWLEKPTFYAEPPLWVSGSLAAFVRSRLAQA